MPGEGKNDADLERIPKTYTQKRIRQTKPPPTPVLPGGPADPDRHIVQVDPDKIQVIQTRSTRGYPRGALAHALHNHLMALWVSDVQALPVVVHGQATRPQLCSDRQKTHIL